MKFKGFVFLALAFSVLLLGASADTYADNKKAAHEVQQAGEVQPAEATSMDTETKVINKEADRYGGGRCRYGCCGYGLYGRCRRCCMNANEAAAALVAEDEDQANKYVRGGGRCRYGCCGYGQFGSCRRCCMTANEAEAFQIEEKNEVSDKQNLVANKDATYGGGWGGYGGGWSGGRGGGYGWGGGPGGGGYGWGGRGGGGGYGWGGGGGGHGSGYGGGNYGGGRCRYGCCGGHGYHGGCTRCCYSVQEAQSMQSEVKP